jgi:hypothetical protein
MGDVAAWFRWLGLCRIQEGENANDQLVQFIVPALEIDDPVQCRLEMSGMLDFGMPKVV